MAVILTLTRPATMQCLPPRRALTGKVVDDQQGVPWTTCRRRISGRADRLERNRRARRCPPRPGVDLWLALRIGILSEGLPNDGVGYSVEAKAMLRSLHFNGVGALREVSPGIAPGWVGLMTGHL